MCVFNHVGIISNCIIMMIIWIHATYIYIIWQNIHCARVHVHDLIITMIYNIHKNQHIGFLIYSLLGKLTALTPDWSVYHLYSTFNRGFDPLLVTQLWCFACEKNYGLWWVETESIQSSLHWFCAGWKSCSVDPSNQVGITECARARCEYGS